MNRRDFLALLAKGGAAAVALATVGMDPELVGWEPGRKAFSLPASMSFHDGFFNLGDIVTIDGHFIKQGDLILPDLQKYVVTGVQEHYVELVPPPRTVGINSGGWIAPKKRTRHLPWHPPVKRDRRG